MSKLYWPIPIFIGLIVLITGLRVYFRDPGRRLNQLFLLETCVIFLWSGANSFVVFQWDVLPLRTFGHYWTYSVGFLMAPIFALFSCYLPTEKRPSKKFFWSTVLISAFSPSLLFAVNLFPNLPIQVSPKSRLFNWLFLLLFSFYVLYGLKNVWVKVWRAKNPLERKQLKILEVGLLSSFTLGIASGIIAPIVAMESCFLHLSTVFATLIFAGFTGYAVTKYGFMAPLRYAMIQIFKSFHAGIIITDYSGEIIRLNPMLKDLFGITDDGENKALSDFTAAVAGSLESHEDASEFRDWLGSREDEEREFSFAGNISKSVIITKRQIKDSHGFQMGMVYTFLDNTERKRLTQELQESRDHLEGLLENANDIIITCKEDGKILSANKMALKLSGIQDGNGYGQSIFDFIHPEYVEGTRLWAKGYLTGKETPAVFQLELIGVDGERIPLETSLNIIESNGKVTGVQAIARDLRPRLQAESQIRELQKINEQIIRNAQTGIVTIDKNGVFITVNPAFAEIIGEDSPDYLIGKNVFEFPVVKTYLLADALKKTLNGETLEQTFDFHTLRTNKQVNIKAFGTPLVSEEGQVYGALVIVADLRREKELERQLIQSEKLSSIGKLISGVAHELNNPLTAIMGYSQFLSEDETLQEKPLLMMQKIGASAERCRKIVANLLSYVRMKPPEKCRVNINELLEKTLELREHDFRFKNIDVRKNLQPDLPLTAGDPDQLQQVFLNLINNAFDAINERNRTPGFLDICTYQSHDNYIIIEFADNGPGVDARIREKIFDPFFTTKPVGRGTGLGLSLSLGIIGSHGGSLSLDLSYRDGSKFIVKIPVEEVLQGEKSPHTPGEMTISPQRILLVDDEEQILECTKMLLENENYQVTTAVNGQEARARLSGEQFDLIITDLRMPGGIDGKQLYRIVLKELPHLAGKMIFITGDTLEQETHDFLSSIPNHHVKKPFTSKELINAVTAVTESASKLP